MTKDETLDWLYRLRSNIGVYMPREWCMPMVRALDVVIKTLEQERWIPCSERMPKEREWIGTKRFGTTISDEVYVTFEASNGERFCDHVRFQNGKLSESKQIELNAIAKSIKPVAWRELPQPWRGDNGA